MPYGARHELVTQKSLISGDGAQIELSCSVAPEQRWPRNSDDAAELLLCLSWKDPPLTQATFDISHSSRYES